MISVASALLGFSRSSNEGMKPSKPYDKRVKKTIVAITSVANALHKKIRYLRFLFLSVVCFCSAMAEKYSVYIRL